jgi:cytochrome c-type biogenesis protein CcmH/NrfG
MSLRNKYVLAGIGGAVLLAAVIVVVGSLAGASDEGDTGVPTASASSLPPGHPAVSGDKADATPAATTSSSLKRSVSQLEKKSEAHPNDVTLLLKLGDVYFLAQRYSQAEKAFQQVLRLKPSDPAATVRLAMVWHADGDTQRAVHAIQGVLEEQPKDQEAHYSMAIVLFSQERVQEARDEWAKAADIDPTSIIGRRSQNFVDLIDGQESSEGSGGGD